jgi:hypothetical protein
VLWFGAIGDRYGRKQMLLTGELLSILACPGADDPGPRQRAYGGRGGGGHGLPDLGCDHRLEPTGVYKYDDGRPLLDRELRGKSQRELRDLGLTVEEPTSVAGG